MTTIPTTEPDVFYAGDFVTWKIELSDYPADESWQLTYSLVKSGYIYTATASASGADHLVEIAAATSADYQPGTYRYQGRVSKSTEIYVVRTGRLEIKPDFSQQTTGYDDRSHAEIMVEKLRSIEQARPDHDIASYSHEGRSLAYFSRAEVIDALAYYEAIVTREKVAAGEKVTAVKAQFGPIS